MNDFDKRNVCCWLEVEELEERESSRCPWPVCTCYCCCYCCYCCCCYYCCCYCYCCCYYCCCCFCSSGYGQSQLTAARVMASDQRSENFRFFPQFHVFIWQALSSHSPRVIQMSEITDISNSKSNLFINCRPRLRPALVPNWPPYLNFIPPGLFVTIGSHGHGAMISENQLKTGRFFCVLC